MSSRERAHHKEIARVLEGPGGAPNEKDVGVIQGLRPGVIAFSLGHGHWSYGGKDVAIDGKVIEGDKRRIKGIHANAAMRIDPVLKNTTLVDVYGGSAVFYDSMVKLVKA